MTAAATYYAHVFKAGGDHYFQLHTAVLTLPPGDRVPTLEVGAAMMILAREDKNLDPTDAEIAAKLPSDRRHRKSQPKKPGHRSRSHIQKGLRGLEKLLGVLRRKRKGGGRVMEWIRGLKPKPDRGPESDAPPSTPLEEERKDTTTKGGSSSSPGETPEKTGEIDPAIARPLHELAGKVVTGASFGAVLAAVGTYSADWVRRALRLAEKWHRKTGNRKPWGWVLGILLNWEKQDGPPDDEPDPKAAEEARHAARAEEARQASEEQKREEARLERVRGAWGLLTDAERSEILATVRTANPGIRNPSVLQSLALGELERRMAERPRAP